MARNNKKSAARQSLRDRVRANTEKKKSEKGGGSRTVTLPDDVKFLEVKKGTMLLDIIPYEVQSDSNPIVGAGELWYERTYFIHRNIGSDNAVVVCPMKTLKKACPICEHRKMLMKDWDTNEEMIKALRPSERQLFNVINLDKESAGIQVLDISAYCFGEVVEKEISEGEEEWAGFPDLVDGYTVKARFGEVSLGKNSFLQADRVDFKERDDYEDAILDEAIDLDACLNIMSAKDLENLFFEIDTSEEEEETPRRSRKAAPEPEEDPEPEEEAPRTRRTRKKPETKEEPEEEEKPKSRRSRKAAPEPEEDPALEEKPKSRRTRNKPEPEPEEENSECPEGGAWGIDCDKLDACNECDKWEHCMDEKDRLAAAKKRK